MHHRLEHPRSGSVVHLRVGDTLEVALPQQAARQPWEVTLRPHGVQLLGNTSGSGERGAWRGGRLMFRAMAVTGGILRLEERDRPDGDQLELLVAVEP